MKVTTSRSSAKKVTIHISRNMNTTLVCPPYVTNGHIIFHRDTWESMGNSIDITGSNASLRNKALGYFLQHTPFMLEKTFSGEIVVREKQDSNYLINFTSKKLRNVRDMEGLWVEVAPLPDKVTLLIKHDYTPSVLSVVPMACRAIDSDNNTKVKAIFVQAYTYDILMEFYGFIGSMGGSLDAPFAKVPEDFFESDSDLHNPIFTVMQLNEGNTNREIVLSMCMPCVLGDNNQIRAWTEYMKTRRINWRWVTTEKPSLQEVSNESAA